ncbi:Mediator of RNA polymerase II transcription subunit 6 [Penicillium canariense]|uniref:Mediator of RNA polymerase II transcription subunit 6 n=1 Tax=Penicillium canariense TaxID=189055 RepID=A0A9W9I211_9EURO|nr:Mediator of RNA polymerase II transcription subunit 6 [Penicillium canariense]KAJ5166454.1 Mediator of RNA polymerase II transcription subunit 6 [Penicillium canariense]
MATQEAAMEEILWTSPPHVKMMGGFLHSNNILFYFAESPFFDPTSNNASLAIQASYNEAFRDFVETRAKFEARLKTMQGLEFVVAFDPLEAAQTDGNRLLKEPSNIWVIRKQNRRKRTGMEDEVTVISTYFVVGETIYMAPSVASVVGNRILSAVTSLSRLMKSASTLPTFTPSYGHTYLPPTARTAEPGQQASQPSKENTPMPDATQSSGAEPQSAGKAGLGISTTSSSYQDTRNLGEAFNLFTQYGDEFMDENPLVGEPGSFILSRAGENDRAAGTAAKAALKAAPSTTVNTPAGLRGRSTTPQVRIDTPGKASEKSNSPPSSGENKGKRKKNRIAS